MSSLKEMESGVISEREKPMETTESDLPPEVAALMKEFSGAKGKKLMRKLDLRLIPIVSHFG